MKAFFALFLISLLSLHSVLAETSGAVNLDSKTFDKVIDGHRPVIVRVDKKWSTSTPFKELSEKVAASNTRLLLAEISVADYGEKENQDLADRFAVAKDDYPAFLFFPQSSSPATDVKKFVKETTTSSSSSSSAPSADDLIRFLKKNGVSMGLPGTLTSFDTLAAEFVKNEATRADVLEEAEKAAAELEKESAEKLPPADLKQQKNDVETYLRIMKAIVKEGYGYVEKEIKRLEKLIADKSVKKDKKDFFSRRLNVVLAFSPVQ